MCLLHRVIKRRKKIELNLFPGSWQYLGHLSGKIAIVVCMTEGSYLLTNFTFFNLMDNNLRTQYHKYHQTSIFPLQKCLKGGNSRVTVHLVGQSVKKVWSKLFPKLMCCLLADIYESFLCCLYICLCHFNVSAFLTFHVAYICNVLAWLWMWKILSSVLGTSGWKGCAELPMAESLGRLHGCVTWPGCVLVVITPALSSV